MTVRITAVTAYPISFAVPPEFQVSLGIGRTVKRDAVLVRVDTNRGVSGWGEAHAARAPSAIAELINTTLRQLVTGMDALDTGAVWERVYRMQIASHGAGAAAVIGLSGIDLALWDIQGRIADKSVCALLGMPTRDVPAYAGGIALGFSPPRELVEEARGLIAQGYRALKLRVGDSPANDCARIEAVRKALGDSIDILVDANTAYTLDDVREVRTTLADCRVGWLEEPFPAHDYRSYIEAAALLETPLAAGENHYTRFDFERARDDGAIRVWQPDLSKTGGLTEGFRIAGMAADAGITIHPHTSLTALNMSASLQFLCAIPNGGYFEADTSRYNPWRDDFVSSDRLTVNADGSFSAPQGAGLGTAPKPDLAARYPMIGGGGYV